MRILFVLFYALYLTNISFATTSKTYTPFSEKEILQEYNALQAPHIPNKSALAIQNFFAKFKIYEPWYIIPVYYSFNKMYSPRLQKIEFKSQISFRLELLDNIICDFCSFSFGYTQRIYLQTYNGIISSPLRDIDLSPQIGFAYKKPIYIKGNSYINWISIYYNHTSNGETNRILADDLRGEIVRSKALDRIVFETNYNNNNFNMRIRTYIIIGVFDGGKTNPDIGKYIGYGDVKFSYKYGKNLFELSANNILNNYFDSSYWKFKGQLELGYSYGITSQYALFVQYILGHGDSLYEYSLPVNRIGIGVRLRDF
ncbi:phospholipase [Helicobacter muridarum]|uniref:Phosphatidylcholine 1-acylhydrolase n=1 Tax=Helicobacter muridarum TaxID=216 RepID=A0A377PU31_9HELI|nr:phospholipase A [Helicobacter muridarum]TLE00046.1 phospholipase [Helicobacter muridarum]STQ86107.1 phospholipase A [Helicobacter muridarum]